MENIIYTISTRPTFTLLGILILAAAFILAKNISITISMDFKKHKFKIILNKKVLQYIDIYKVSLSIIIYESNIFCI